MKKLYLPLLICFAANSCIGQIDFSTLMDQGNKAYQSGDFRGALNYYDEVLQSQRQSAPLYYNIGNCYYRLDEFGKAVLFYERAARLKPNDRDIQHNLAVVNTKLVDRIEPISPFFLESWWNNTRKLASTKTWAIVGLIFLWGGVLGTLVWIIGKTRVWKKWGFLGGIAAFVLAILCLSLANSQYWFEKDSNIGILLVDRTILHLAPEMNSPEVRVIHEGVKFKIEGKIENWKKVRLYDGEVGWLPNETLEQI